MPQSVPERIGRYAIEAELGTGSAGTVYRARDTVLDRPVAIRAISFRDDPEVARRMREVAKLHHKNISSFDDCIKDNDVFFFVTRFMTCDNLRTLIAKRPGLSLAESVRIMIQAGEALLFAQRQGIVHGSLKPSRIWVQKNGKVEVADFCVEQRMRNFASRSTSDADSIGDIRYMAPEQFHGEQDPRSDIFAFGIVCYEFITGEYPFEAEDTFALSREIVSANPVPLQSLARFPRWLASMIGKAVRKDPEGRYQSFEELLRDAAQVIEEPLDTRLLADTATSFGAPTPTPPPLDENVQFTVYRPLTVPPGHWKTLLAFAHRAERRLDSPANEPDPIAEVRRQAEQFLSKEIEQYQDLRQDSSLPIPREGELTFVPEMTGVEFNPRQLSLLWQESVHRCEFRFRASQELDGKVARGRISIFLGSIIVAQVVLTFRVNSRESQPVRDAMEPVRAPVYRKIFASYSHKDVAVVEEFERYARAIGDEYLRDFIHLRTGEVWDQRLLELIDRANVFQLFWSSNSIRSENVAREWRHALTLNRNNFVRPVYWEEPLPNAPELGLPPDELRALHFQRVVPGVSQPIARSTDTVTSGERERTETSFPSWSPPPQSQPVPQTAVFPSSPAGPPAMATPQAIEQSSAPRHLRSRMLILLVVILAVVIIAFFALRR